MENCEYKKSRKQRLVYDLFYPAILGSMLYDMFTFSIDSIYSIKAFIVLFYLMDYYHLYFFMDENFDSKEKDSKTYVLCDFFISILFLIAFKFIIGNQLWTIWLITLIPICFLIYSYKLKYELKFYSIYAITSVLMAILSTLLICRCDCLYEHKYIVVLNYVIVLFLIYSSFVISHNNQPIYKKTR
jgi:hypothetical protein